MNITRVDKAQITSLRHGFILLFVLCAILSGMSTSAQYLSYQGMVYNEDGEIFSDGDYMMGFSIYNSSKVLLWHEDHPDVKTEGGHFHVLLGIIKPIELPFDQEYFLGISIAGKNELNSLIPLASVPYSLHAKIANSIDGFEASTTPEPNKLLALDTYGKFPPSVFRVKKPEYEGIRKNTRDSSVASTARPVLSALNTGSDRGLFIESKGSKALISKNNSDTQAAIEGENFGLGAGLRGTSKLHHGVIGYSESATNAGVLGNNQNGTGVWGNSIEHHGVSGQTNDGHAVYGETAAADKSAILGENSQGFGVNGRSNANDGVVGWTNSAEKSGVFGFSLKGSGVIGRSDNKEGVLAVTQSTNPGHAAIWARNEGNGPALAAEGELHVTGRIRGNYTARQVAPFMRPAYDSGWKNRSQAGWTPHAINHQLVRVFDHNIGGEPDDYIVELKFRGSDFGIHNYRYGGDYYAKGEIDSDPNRPPNPEEYWNYGCFWNELTQKTIKVNILTDDNHIQEVRVRIWTMY